MRLLSSFVDLRELTNCSDDILIRLLSDSANRKRPATAGRCTILYGRVEQEKGSAARDFALKKWTTPAKWAVLHLQAGYVVFPRYFSHRSIAFNAACLSAEGGFVTSSSRNVEVGG